MKLNGSNNVLKTAVVFFRIKLLPFVLATKIIYNTKSWYCFYTLCRNTLNITLFPACYKYYYF